MICSLKIDKTLLPKGVEIADSDWQQVPQSVLALIVLLLKIIDALTAKLGLDSATSNRPPSTDPPFLKKNRDVKPETAKGKPGARKGHQGYRQPLLEPTETRPVPPGSNCPRLFCRYCTLSFSKAAASRVVRSAKALSPTNTATASGHGLPHWSPKLPALRETAATPSGPFVPPCLASASASVHCRN